MKRLRSFYLNNGPERVGYIRHDGRVIELENVHPDPFKGFALRAEDLKILQSDAIATWHTHPGGTALLSGEDYLAFLSYPQLQHFVIGEDSVRCYAVEENFIVELGPEDCVFSRFSEGDPS